MERDKEMDMTTSFRIFSLGIIFALLLSACNLSNNTPTVNGQPVIQETPQPTPIPVMGLTVNYDTAVPFNAVDQTINYTYLITNASGSSIPGPVTVTDDRITVTCPEVTTVGNLDNNLDVNETLTCTGNYAITQLDLNAGSVTSIATASAGGNYSSAVTTTVPLEQTRVLTLSKTADPPSYTSANQTITYNYVITNTGNVTLGPVQFAITDDKVGTALNCGADATTLDPASTVSCSLNYTITDADVTAGLVTNNASASDGTTTSSIVTATINRGIVSNPSNLQPGSTIQHQVVAGEWLWQIARCYGADPKQVILSNPQLPNPAQIKPGITVTVPNIGAGGRTIYGPPCITTHTVQSSETWSSIAQLYNADPNILQDVNPGALTPGRVLKVPLNSAGGS
jgi:LysM repeat protein